MPYVARDRRRSVRHCSRGAGKGGTPPRNLSAYGGGVNEIFPSVPWAVRELTTNEIVGSTRYHDIVAPINRVEMGST
jgi:hypothetical protein